MQPNYANYPRPPVEEVSFSTLSEGFNVLSKNFGVFLLTAIVSSVLLYLPPYALAVVGFAMGGGLSSPDGAGAQALSTLFQLFGLVIGFGLAGPLFGSMCHMTLKWSRGEAIEFADVSFGFNRFIPFAVAGVLVIVATLLGVLGCIVGTIVVGGLLMLTFPLIADRGLAPVDAMKASWGMLSKHILMASCLYFVANLLSNLCCFIMPILMIVSTLVYRDFTGVGPTMATPTGTPMAPSQPTPTETPPPTEPPSGEGG